MTDHSKRKSDTDDTPTDQNLSYSITPSLVRPCPWNGIKISRNRLAPNEFFDWSTPLFHVDLHLSQPYELEWKQGRRYNTTRMAAGALCVFPSDEPISLRWNDRLETISVALTRPLLQAIAADLKMSDELVIREHHGDVDLQIAHLCRALWAEADAGYPMGNMFGDSLSTALAACLLQRYNETPDRTSAPGKLSPRLWKQLEDFVEENLTEDLRLEELAQIANLSPFHFSRCFKETAGTTPHQYLITRRVERARHLVAESSLSLAEAASLSGFSDQSHLARHMKRLLGVTPKSLLQHRNRRKIVR